MGYRGRVLLLTTVAAYLLSALIVAAQSAPRKDAPAGIEPQSQASGDHGLVLILSHDATPEPTDPAALKTCLAHNPSPACVPLTLTIKNEGKETIPKLVSYLWSGVRLLRSAETGRYLDGVSDGPRKHVDVLIKRDGD